MSAIDALTVYAGYRTRMKSWRLFFASQPRFCAICCRYCSACPHSGRLSTTEAVSSPRPSRLTELRRDYPEIGVVRHLLCGCRRAMRSDSCSMTRLCAITTRTTWDTVHHRAHNRCTVYDAISERSSSVGNNALDNLYFYIILVRMF